LDHREFDFVVVGGGIVGLSTAWQLQRLVPDSRVLVLEKEKQLASHQTGRNSGVVHAGIYYAPGSMKAKFCRQGLAATIEFCAQNKIPFNQCGKLVVATSDLEAERLTALFRRGLENGLDLELLDESQIRRIEPYVSGYRAILVRETAIVDFARVASQMAGQFVGLGGQLSPLSEVVRLQETGDRVDIGLSDGRKLSGKFLVTCAGLMADRIVRMMDIPAEFQIIPYRGEYYRLSERLTSHFQHLIYPVPDPDLPFLGVHITRMIDGTTTVGPNAVQGWKREGYGRLNLSVRDTVAMLTFPGFWRVSAQHAGTGLREFRDSVWKRGYLERIRKYAPDIRLSDLTPYRAGVRAQAVMRDGALVDDFLFAESPRSMHVCSAPSPAATSAIPMGAYLAQSPMRRFESVG